MSEDAYEKLAPYSFLVGGGREKRGRRRRIGGWGKGGIEIMRIFGKKREM